MSYFLNGFCDEMVKDAAVKQPKLTHYEAKVPTPKPVKAVTTKPKITKTGAAKKKLLGSGLKTLGVMGLLGGAGAAGANLGGILEDEMVGSPQRRAEGKGTLEYRQHKQKKRMLKHFKRTQTRHDKSERERKKAKVMKSDSGISWKDRFGTPGRRGKMAPDVPGQSWEDRFGDTRAARLAREKMKRKKERGKRGSPVQSALEGVDRSIRKTTGKALESMS